ncbi:hypothetical protein LIER_02516 [Lithospermum erythrorhizon]|uniref:Chorein N-terminal domain-containing protein n=1 Tax=Lithospermum erythrorhizon TaxID=34254 RepID=A0AAV3NUF1_LITER
MESIIARALEYTLKYWLKSFSRDQFKLQGRTAQLSNLDINGDALHASIGLPPAISVTTAKVGKLEIVLPSVSNVQVEPIVVQIDRLDLVLVENDYVDESKSSKRLSKSTSSKSAKSSGYGFADKIADGMTLEVRTVNLLLETHGGMRHKGGASWASPMASITIHNLLLYTTNENWQVVNLKEARDFSSDKKQIFVFKKLEWESLSIDLLPHPDMFTDANVDGSGKGSTKKDEDGAKRVFFGGERFIEGISGEAHITIQRTELNSPLGLEVQLHITEAICPAISEPGLRALLRFMTGFYVCLNRGDVNPNKQSSTEAAGRSLVSVVVDHVFFCIKDSEFQLELLMQSLSFSRTSVSDGENAKHLTHIMINGLFLRDTFSRPPCTLVQPMMSTAPEDILSMPEFAENFCPPIYPLGDQDEKPNFGVPLLCLYSLQLKPSPAPPILASQSVIECQPLMIHIQEESCLRIASFLADGIVVNPRAVSPEFTINSLTFNLKGLDATVPMELGSPENIVIGGKTTSKNSFVGARLLIEKLFYHESPGLSLRLLNLEKDPACFSLWKGQPVDASLKKMKAGATLVSISLETCQGSAHIPSSPLLSSGLGRCVDLKDFCLEVAMATADGSPLLDVPPPGGVVRIGVAFQQFLSNMSVEQLFLILDLYSYFGKVSEKIAVIGKHNPLKEFRDEGSCGSMMDKVPGDTAISLAMKHIQLTFLESSSEDHIQGVPLVQFVGQDLFAKVTHRTLGGAMAISSDLTWESIEVDCADTSSNLLQDNEGGNRNHQLRSVLWVQNKGINSSSVKAISGPFLVVNLVHVIPYNARDMACHSLSVSVCITGLRLGGGMNYAEALLHRFGIFGPDGGPGEGLTKGLEHLSGGPLSKLLKTSPTILEKIKENKILEDEENNTRLKLGTPDDLDVCIELNDWLFALEGAQEEAQSWWFVKPEDAEREDRSWHTTFSSVCINTKGGPKSLQDGEVKSYENRKYPVDFITVGVVGLQILKPLAGKSFKSDGMLENGLTKRVESHSGVNFDVDIVTSEDDMGDEMPNWVVENMKFSVKEPIEAVVTKDELEYLTILCKSEVDSMGRITAGVLRLLKLESSIGPQGISQLSNLGSEGFDKIFSPRRLSRGSSPSSIGPSTASSVVDSGRSSGLSYTVSSLEEVMLEAQTKCAAISAAMSTSTTSEAPLDDHVKDLRQKLASMQKLLQNLKSQI